MEQTEADTTAILPEDVLSSQTEEDSCSDRDLHTYKDEKDVASRYRSANGPLSPCALGVTVEPVAFFCYFSFALQSPLHMQYLWERISGDLGYNGTKERGCGNSSGPQHTLEQEVEALTTYWSMYINLGSFAVCLFTVPLLGSWSDCAGRRKLLILSSLGLVLQAAVFLMVVYFRLHVAWFFLGKTLSGLTGDLNTLLAGCFAYVADVSDTHSRTFRVALLEATLGLSSILANAIGGPWLRAQGYIGPFWLVLACGLAATVYVCLFVRESVTPDPHATLFTLKHYKAVFRLCCSREQGQNRARLWLYFFSMFIVVVVHFGTHNLYVLYELSTPLCWGPVLIGIGSATLSMSYLCSLVGLRIMRHYVNDSWMAIVGLVSNMAGLVVISVANTTALMFTGYAIIFLYLVPTPVLRSKLSKLVSASNQGALFAAVACIVEMCSLVANGVFSSLYPATLNIMKGLPFLLGAGLLLIPVAIIWAVRCQEEREESNLLTEVEPGHE